jgi:hypothetical protein
VNDPTIEAALPVPSALPRDACIARSRDNEIWLAHGSLPVEGDHVVEVCVQPERRIRRVPSVSDNDGFGAHRERVP